MSDLVQPSDVKDKRGCATVSIVCPTCKKRLLDMIVDDAETKDLVRSEAGNAPMSAACFREICVRAALRKLHKQEDVSKAPSPPSEHEWKYEYLGNIFSGPPVTKEEIYGAK